jgi:membrane-associated phospholipid phosphatase
LLDESIRNGLADAHNPTLDWITRNADPLGTNTPAAIASGGVYLTGLVFDWPRVRMIGRHTFQALLYSAFATTVLKYTFGRDRPQVENGPYSFNWFESNDAQNSLPSGHTTLVFAVASTLSAEFDNPFLTAGLYGVASMTGFARMYYDRHWASDVLFSALIGTAVGYGVVHLHDVEDQDADGMSWRLVPGINRVTLVVML